MSDLKPTAADESRSSRCSHAVDYSDGIGCLWVCLGITAVILALGHVGCVP